MNEGDRFERVLAQIEHLLDLGEEARGAALMELAREAPELIDDVRELLGRASGGHADGGLVERARGEVLALLAADLADTPRQVGRYRVTGVLGSGGMGTVYRAEQERPRREVALKVLPPSTATAALAARFEREAEVLARLSHPGIAQVFDAGVDLADGTVRRWIAMELVDGRPITEHAAAAHLDPRSRARLLLAVCEAVAHAHARGVLHRDLKPANVLIGADGRPRVLDFGVALLLDPRDGASSFATAEGHLVGTLAYLSPEQAAGEVLDARSDVYGLGLLGYELLAGRRAQEVNGLPLAEALRRVQEHEPRGAGTLDRRLRGDLDTILATALAKDRRRRYASAEAMAADLRRYLADEPIAAHPPSTVYQIVKFARRHRALVLGLAGTLLALLVGLVGTTVQAARAARQAEAARASERRATDATAVLLQLFRAGQTHRPGEGLSVSAIVREGSAALEAALIDAPLERAELLGALGEALLYDGKLSDARRLLLEALRLRREHGPDPDPDAWRLHFALGPALKDLGEPVQAEDHLREAVESLRWLPLETLGASRHHALANLATLLCERGRHSEALALLEEAQGVARVLRSPLESKGAVDLAIERYHVQPSEAAYLAVRERHRAALGPRLRGEELAALQRAVGELVLQHAVDVADPERAREGMDLVESACLLLEGVVGRDVTLACALMSLATGRGFLGDPEGALALQQEATRLLELHAGGHPTALDARRRLGVMQSERGEFEAAFESLRSVQERGALSDVNDRLVLADLYQRAQRFAEALLVLCELKEQILAHPHPDGALLEAIDARQAVCSLLAGDAAQAAPLFAEQLADRRRRGARETLIASSEQLLGWSLLRLGRVDEAEPLILGGCERFLGVAVPLRSVRGQLCVRSLVELHDARGRTDEARRWRAHLVAGDRRP